MSRCYAVASGKGGVGKSAFTANLGAVISQSGSRVLIIDADIGLRSQDALLSLENRVVYDLIDLIKGDCLPEEAILPTDGFPALFLLPAAQFSRAKSLDPGKFSKSIQKLRDRFDYILIDCPAGIERGLRNVLKAGADETVLIATPDDISIRSAERTCQIIEAKNQERPLLIVNRLDPRLIRSGDMMKASAVAQVLDLPLLGEIPEDPAVYRAQLRHELFAAYDCEARNALVRIASRIQGKSVSFPSYGSRKLPFFSRLFPYRLKEVVPIDNH